MNIKALTSNELEAANRAEATALLIRSGYRVYRPEADCYGEDLILRTPNGELRAIQLKGRPTVDWRRYGNRSLWMLFPGSKSKAETGRNWFLVPHDQLFEWIKKRHGQAPKWNDAWSYPTVSKQLSAFLNEFVISAPRVAEIERAESEGSAQSA